MRRGQRKAGMGERPGKGDGEGRKGAGEYGGGREKPGGARPGNGQSAETALAGEFGLDVKKRVKALFTGYGSIFRLILGLCGGADYVACEPTENLRGALCSVSGPAGTGLPHREHGWPCGG